MSMFSSYLCEKDQTDIVKRLQLWPQNHGCISKNRTPRCCDFQSYQSFSPGAYTEKASESFSVFLPLTAFALELAKSTVS